MGGQGGMKQWEGTMGQQWDETTRGEEPQAPTTTIASTCSQGGSWVLDNERDRQWGWQWWGNNGMTTGQDDHGGRAPSTCHHCCEHLLTRWIMGAWWRPGGVGGWWWEEQTVGTAMMRKQRDNDNDNWGTTTTMGWQVEKDWWGKPKKGLRDVQQHLLGHWYVFFCSYFIYFY